jgi:zinc D-Ala-D-Ala carboxypeptidase
MQLTTHFTLTELTRSAKAQALGLDNTPPQEIVPRLILLAEMLERIRAAVRSPVIVTSGYRCRAVNEAVGGVKTSDHTQGHAADIVAPGYGTPYSIAKMLAKQLDLLGIGQVILEGFGGAGGKQWIHVSTHIPEKLANRAITITDKGPQLGIQEIG